MGIKGRTYPDQQIRAAAVPWRVFTALAQYWFEISGRSSAE